MKTYIFGNPFFLREWWVWQREMPRWQLIGPRLLMAILMGAPFIVMTFAAILFGSFSMNTLTIAWGLAAFFWLGALSWFSVSATIHVYHYERDIGTLSVAGLTGMQPFREILGRWMGAQIQVYEGWIMGLSLVVLALFLFPASFMSILCAWAFSALWTAALGAIGITCSAAYRTALSSIAAFFNIFAITAVLSVPLAAAALYMLSPQSPITLSWCYFLPPCPMAFYFLFSSPVPPAALFVLALTWTCCILVFLGIASWCIARGIPLQVESTGHMGPSGLIPVTASPLAIPEAPDPRAASLARKKGEQTRVPREGLLAGMCLWPFRHNPFYIAYLRGFMRIYRGNTAAPGSIVPPAVVITGLICSCLMYFDGSSSVAADTIVITLAAATLLSFWASIAMGNRVLQAERNQSTWPMLLATGMMPGKVLAGKFAGAFYALSGEWTYTVPFWCLAALCGQKPGLLALSLVQPAFIALGILTGLWMACQPRFLILNLNRAGAITLGIFVVWLIAYGTIPDLPGALRLCCGKAAAFINPCEVLTTMGLCSDPAALVPAFMRFLLEMALVAAIALLIAVSAGRRLNRVMLGE